MTEVPMAINKKPLPTFIDRGIYRIKNIYLSNIIFLVSTKEPA